MKKYNEGTITIKFGANKDVVMDDVVSYTPPKGYSTDLSKAKITGYTFSHKKVIDGKECFVFDRDESVINGYTYFNLTLVD